MKMTYPFDSNGFPSQHVTRARKRSDNTPHVDTREVIDGGGNCRGSRLALRIAEKSLSAWRYTKDWRVC